MRAIGWGLLVVVTIAVPAWSQILTGTCVSEVSVRRRGLEFGPVVAVEGARYRIPGATECNKGWTVEIGGTCEGGGDTWCEQSADIEPSRDGEGCDLVIDLSRCVVEDFDLATDPRVRRR